MRLLNEFIALWNLVEQVQLTPGVPDTFCWRLTVDGRYSASSAHGAMFLGSSTPLGACKASLEDFGTTTRKVFLLACPAWSLLDGA
jgi:hypothetical protein